jgi:hypothetical protein
MISAPGGESPGSMGVLDYAVGEGFLTRLGRYGTVPDEPEAEPDPLLVQPLVLSPELVLVAPYELAVAARESLPEPVPFDDWLRRVRARELAAEPLEPDWEYVRRAGRRDAVGVAFALVLALASALPVVLLVLDRSG